MTRQQGAVPIIQNSIPVRYSARVKVLPCNPDRVPQLSVDILYLIAQTLPRPKWVYNFARINKQSWFYLQPALFQCEVTYEARLRQHFLDDDEPLFDASDYEIQPRNIKDTHCRHGWKTTLCEECGDRIAIEEVTFRSNQHDRYLSETGAAIAQVTALHWACAKGPDGVPAGLNAIRAASAHQPSYIDGKGLMLRYIGYRGSSTRNVRLCGEIPPPLFMAVAFGNVDLCKALIQAGCNVNVIQPGENCQGLSPCDVEAVFEIHDKCTSRGSCDWDVHPWAPCRTAGHVALRHNRPALLKLLLDGGLDPHLGRESLIHEAVYAGNRSATRLLLDRYPELSRFQDERRDRRTPLHELARTALLGPWERSPLGLFKDIASDLMEKGASLEAMAIPTIWYDHQGTPLQYALQTADQDEYWEGDPLYAAEALIQIGCVWSQPVSSARPTESILDHCISRATLCYKASFPFSSSKQSFSEKHMAYARLVKAIVESERGRVNLNVPARKAFLDAFNDLAARSIPLPTQYDAFATEVVGKLLLSTGITPDASHVSNWTQSIRKIQGWTAESPAGYKRSLEVWEDIMSDWPTSREGPKDESRLTGAPELLGLFSGKYWY